MKPSLVHIAAAALVAGLPLPAQEEAPPVREAREVLEAQWKTNTHARALRLRIPAPRGLITDRHGRPLAQNRVVRQMAINFPLLRNATDAEILAFARRQFASAGAAVGQTWDLEDKVILNHYQNRRWLPLTFTPILTEEQEKKLEPLKSEHLFLHASYQRFYPQGTSAAHIVGYVGKVGWFPTGPAENGDPLWEDSEGRAGLELTMDKDLKGKEGNLSALFGADGSRISWEVETKPVPGHTVVTTIDLAMQKRVESILAQNSRRGAFVVMDVKTGEVLVMGSWPSFDPNIFIPSISPADLAKLNEDPSKPLLARAYQSMYPPASVYKLAVGLAALDSGLVNKHTLLPGPPSLQVGNRVFNNWSKTHEGDINLEKAIARSTNTWFYQVALKMGGDPLIRTSAGLGFGQRTGIPLVGEARGFVPDHAWAQKVMGRPKLAGGDLANFAIGQGALLATPLQVCRAMAALGNGAELPPVRLVRQVQDLNHNLLPVAETRGTPLTFRSDDIDTILQGMSDVVNSGYGTGKSAGIKAAKVGGKTGTGQWVPAKSQYVAWFAGLVPIDKPKYAFVVLHEGAPGQTVSGGRNAAPLVSSFFGPLMEAEVKADKELLASKKTDAIETAMREAEDAARERAEAEASAGGTGENEDAQAVAQEVLRGINVPVRPARPVAPPPPEPPKKRGLFDRLFGGGR
jgi:penicillin-binding protein 2